MIHEPMLYYWLREQVGSAAEIDYLIEHSGSVLPIEIKSGSTGSLKALHMFMGLKKYQLAVRINTDYPSVTDVKTKIYDGQTVVYRLLSIPSYLVGQIQRLIAQTLVSKVM